MKTISIPNSITTIDHFAFSGCSSLINIDIPFSVERINSCAFEGCTSLKNIIIPQNVSYIDERAFAYCPDIESITVESGNTTYHSSGNCIIETSSNTLIAGCKNSIISDDGSVTIIGNSAFSNCLYLKNINIPSCVTIIGDNAFFGCSELTSIAIPDDIISVGDQAFEGCLSLNYNIYDNAKYLGNTQNLYMVLVESVNTNITSCEIHSDTRIIVGHALYDCINITNITIPQNVEYIGIYTFYGCNNLTSIYFEDLSTWYRFEIFDLVYQTGGTQTNLDDPIINITYFKEPYYGCSWYKK